MSRPTANAWSKISIRKAKELGYQLLPTNAGHLQKLRLNNHLE